MFVLTAIFNAQCVMNLVQKIPDFGMTMKSTTTSTCPTECYQMSDADKAVFFAEMMANSPMPGTITGDVITCQVGDTEAHCKMVCKDKCTKLAEVKSYTAVQKMVVIMDGMGAGEEEEEVAQVEYSYVCEKTGDGGDVVDDKPGDKLSTGAVVGIIVAVAVFAAVVTLLLFFYINSKAKRVARNDAARNIRVV